MRAHSGEQRAITPIAYEKLRVREEVEDIPRGHKPHATARAQTFKTARRRTRYAACRTVDPDIQREGNMTASTTFTTTERPRVLPQIRAAVFPGDTARLVEIIREYVKWLDMDLSYRGFEDEMQAFEQTYALPSGIFFIADAGEELAGCGGLLRHSDEVAEVKRLYVRPAYRGLALGEKLMAEVIDKAKALGFRKLVLDSVPQTAFAQHLYERLGFRETAPYYAHPVAGTRFLELVL
ncbi:GNAT family N-acetyltransferase [Paraburkholderia sp. C35]|uniref:GNAT family N-acetyltransferase n=1 Tax=Paraburkholderia sp. C35 TaxID=2126993 RepID=UPI001EF59AF3|nr:GNAT family N-acetyltransferase [Paraburkholderia sp. C35]